ncbi:hypothetical protein [Noviherbaspirillum aerium]|uniref:hypothetical protein n=1 Tax=Noviherbaspirillum aerium TaxID=2588497 RepID=UPI00124F3726|nr:hypothetical protein [Noviherbaspirillum aerium]
MTDRQHKAIERHPIAFSSLSFPSFLSFLNFLRRTRLTRYSFRHFAAGLIDFMVGTAMPRMATSGRESINRSRIEAFLHGNGQTGTT